MKLLPGSLDEVNKAVLRLLVFLEVVTIALYALALLKTTGESSRLYAVDELYQILKDVSGGFAVVLGLVIWAFWAARYFTCQRYRLAWICVAVGILQTVLFITWIQFESRAKTRAAALGHAEPPYSNEAASVDAPIAPVFQFEHRWWRATEQRCWTEERRSA